MSSRVGSDEFYRAFAGHPTGLRYAGGRAHPTGRCRQPYARSLRTRLQSLPVSASSNLPAKVSTTSEVIRLTRNALRKSKENGKNKVSLTRETPAASGEFDAYTPRTIVEELSDVSSFRTVYQPIIDLDSEEITGYEVLTRGPDGAYENPGDFFPYMHGK